MYSQQDTMKQITIQLKSRQEVAQVVQAIFALDLVPEWNSVPGISQQVTVWVDEDQKADFLVEQLAAFDFVDKIDVFPLWPDNGRYPLSRIRIIESNIGPLISASRASVYDVMEAYDEGYSTPEISKIFNLSPHQVEVALDYIAEHRVTLEPKLKEILIKKAEREKYYRALAAEREKERPPKMTPERIALQALIDKGRRRRGEI